MVKPEIHPKCLAKHPLESMVSNTNMDAWLEISRICFEQSAEIGRERPCAIWQKPMYSNGNYIATLKMKGIGYFLACY